jgi:hypothetical protein
MARTCAYDEPVAGASSEQTKTIMLLTDDSQTIDGLIEAAARAHHVAVLGIDEQPSRGRAKLAVTVRGYPGRLLAFHDELRGDAWSSTANGDVAGNLLIAVTVAGFRSARRKWRGRHDPPLPRADDE